MPLQLDEFIKRCNINEYEESDSVYQPANGDNRCGYYCLYVLDKLNHGNDLKSSIKDLILFPHNELNTKILVDHFETIAGGSFNSVLNKLPIELHYRDSKHGKYSFLGPGTQLYRRLNVDGTWKEWSTPKNRVDEAAYRHDLFYDKYDDAPHRRIADVIMIDELKKITDPTPDEILARKVAKTLLQSKLLLGMGVNPDPRPAYKFLDESVILLHGGKTDHYTSFEQFVEHNKEQAQSPFTRLIKWLFRTISEKYPINFNLLFKKIQLAKLKKYVEEGTATEYDKILIERYEDEINKIKGGKIPQDFIIPDGLAWLYTREDREESDANKERFKSEWKNLMLKHLEEQQKTGGYIGDNFIIPKGLEFLYNQGDRERSRLNKYRRYIETHGGE